MKNLTISLENHPGALARVGEVLGNAGVSIEGGGMFVVDNKGIANFLVRDGLAGRTALETAGIVVMREDDVVRLGLDQDEPGQLGKLLSKMAAANVNVLTQYSDHDHQLILIVDDPAVTAAKTRLHHYSAQVTWRGNTGSGTSSYAGYSRNHEISAQRRAVIEASSDPAFRGDKTRYNPEELLVASASACHMLSYLHLCALNGVVVLSYEDHPTGEMEEILGGPGGFVRVDLHPSVIIKDASDKQRADALHQEAHKNCFIANSLRVPVFTYPQTAVRSRDQ